MFELHPFGLRTDQAEVGEVVALEDRSGQFEVELVVVGHHDAITAGRQIIDFIHRFFADDLAHAMGDLLGEFIFARVDPAHPAGQAGQQRNEGAADVAGTEHGDLRLNLAHRFEQQNGCTTAALAKAGAEAETLQMGVLLAAGEHLAGDLHGLVFQVPATDGVEALVRADDHLRASVARRRAELFDDGHQHAGLTPVLQVGEGVDPVIHKHLNISVVCSGLFASKPAPTF
ncbi:hypothetical protein D3C87_1385180 [compost metagenome]